MAELLDRLQRPAAHNVTGRESMASMMLVAAEALQKQSSKLQALEQFKEWAEPQIADRGELLSRLQALTKDAERADEVRLEQLRAAERLIDSQRSRLLAAEKAALDVYWNYHPDNFTKLPLCVQVVWLAGEAVAKKCGGERK
ncbi:MAG TPA: hypothetical protein VJA26_18645 [Gammaproteobacteria bacterium]|nr:hypothetical protein [Gammaproteobacteria bacterium]